VPENSEEAQRPYGGDVLRVEERIIREAPSTALW
jgi:hypothetical protein